MCLAEPGWLEKGKQTSTPSTPTPTPSRPLHMRKKKIYVKMSATLYVPCANHFLSSRTVFCSVFFFSCLLASATHSFVFILSPAFCSVFFILICCCCHCLLLLFIIVICWLIPYYIHISRCRCAVCLRVCVCVLSPSPMRCVLCVMIMCRNAHI